MILFNFNIIIISYSGNEGRIRGERKSWSCWIKGSNIIVIYLLMHFTVLHSPAVNFPYLNISSREDVYRCMVFVITVLKL